MTKRKAVSALLALALAATAGISGAGTAAAVPQVGQIFLYTKPDGESGHISNPQRAACYNKPGDGWAKNDTQYTAELFGYENCTGPPLSRLGSGEVNPYAEFLSVRFI